jgi:uncharacterized membrane protein YqaE (UPF0057 family)
MPRTLLACASSIFISSGKGSCMRYILAFLAPPFAVLLCRRPVQFVVNLIFWLVSVFVWLICSIHALIVCATSSADRRVNRVVAAIEARSKAAV